MHVRERLKLRGAVDDAERIILSERARSNESGIESTLKRRIVNRATTTATTAWIEFNRFSNRGCSNNGVVVVLSCTQSAAQFQSPNPKLALGALIV